MRRPPVRTMYLNTMQFRARAGLKYPNVKVVSYHIPKAAGTSMAQALINAYGRGGMIGIYRRSKLGPALDTGSPVWIPSQVEVIHGMFKPHPAHRLQFPNARIVTWVRDPLERLISLIRYWIRTDDPFDEEWTGFKKHHNVTNADDLRGLLERLCRDSMRSKTTSFYEEFFEHVTPDHFDFIGAVESLAEETSALNTILQAALELPRLNKAPHARSGSNYSEFRELVQGEYAVLNQFKPGVYG